ncbi:MAG: hypothetical protein LBE75_06145, partial [Burkholderiales bacterium]|nr:hypothetical protein [Burkholderiales bacterium]
LCDSGVVFSSFLLLSMRLAPLSLKQSFTYRTVRISGATSVTVNLGFGASAGGSIEGSPGIGGTPFDGGASFGASGGGGRLGAGFGLQISGGVSTTTTFATRPFLQ